MDNENKEFNQDFAEQAPRAEALKEAEEAEEARVRAAEERGEGAEAAAEMEAEESVMRDVRIVSPTALVLKRFFRSRLSLIGLAMFVVLFIFVFVGPLFVGWGETIRAAKSTFSARTSPLSVPTAKSIPSYRST